MRNVCLSLKFLKFVSDVPSAWLLPAAATSEKRIFQTFSFYEAGSLLSRGGGRALLSVQCRSRLRAVDAPGAFETLEPYVLIAEVLFAGACAVVEVAVVPVAGIAVLLL